MSDSLTIAVDACGRCGEDHPRVQFKPLSVPIRAGGDELTHWASCPANGDPLLLRMTPFGVPNPANHDR